MEVEAAAAAAFIGVAIDNVINVVTEMEMEMEMEISVTGAQLQSGAEMLSKNLESFRNFLYDVEMDTFPNEGVKSWLKELGAVVLDAENVVDELNYDLLSKETDITKPYATKAKLLSCLPSSELHEIEESRLAIRINDINEKLKFIDNERNKLGLIRGSVNKSSLSHRVFVGRDDDVHKLTDLLIYNTEERREQVLSVLVIQGMPGIGKTALAQTLYHHDRSAFSFSVHMWVHVGKAFDPVALMMKIVSVITRERVESRHDITKMLQQCLEPRTFLIVLDDVSNDDVSKLNEFLHLMKDTCTQRSAIIITTRNRMGADIVVPSYTHQLNVLSNEECWSIMKTIIYGNQDVPSVSETIGRKFAQICGGLPLIAIILGGSLCGESEEQLMSILELRQDKGFLNIFRLTFQNLSPSALKTCFAYCSVFPQDCTIVKQELIELWMAEGFLQPHEGNDMESMGETFLNILKDSNFVLQVAKGDEKGNVESYVVPNFMHDLASSVSGGLIPVRYLTLNQESSPVPKQVAKHVRTLFLEGEISDNTLLLDFPSLRSLTLTRVKEMPGSIMILKHLRNLNISKSYITQLPDWIEGLQSLQTLKADTKYLVKLPSTLKLLINLRHLYVLSRVELPAGMGRLTNLRTLRHFAVGEDKGYQIKELKSLNKLKGELYISNLEKVHNMEEATEANIRMKKNLSELVFGWGEEREGEINDYDESVLEGLEPHQNIEKLEIRGFKGQRFPSWTLKMAVRDEPPSSWVPLNNLKQITLSACSECEEIPMLEHLSNLKSLSLIGLKSVRFMNSSPTNLTLLYIRGLKILESLPDSLFHQNPNLSKLEIIECPNLKIIGDPCEGGQYPKGIIRVVRIINCEKLTKMPFQMMQSWVSSLEILELCKLWGLTNLPMVIGLLAKSACLRELKIECGPEFMSTCSIKSWQFGSLQKLHLDVHRERSFISEEKVNDILQGCCNSLTQLCLLAEKNWERVPESIQYFTALSKLELHNFGIEELPEWFGNLSSLSQLSLSSCSRLKRLLSQETLERLTKLRHLDVKDCPDLQIAVAWLINPHINVKVDDRTNEILDEDMYFVANEFLIKNLVNTFKDEYSFIGDVKRLQEHLFNMQSYLTDGRNGSIQQQDVKDWFLKLQALAFSADDALDELNYQLLKSKNKVPSCFSSLHIARQPYMKMIREINMDLDSMIKNAEKLPVKKAIVTEPTAAASSASSNSFTPNPIFIGRDEDVQILVEMLTTEIPGKKAIFSILTIVGKGGVGKEALTRKVLNHEDIKARFGSHVWVHASQISDPITVYKKILSTLTSETNISRVETKESVLKRLQQALKAKTYILVINNVRHEDVSKWNRFIDLIPEVTSTKGNAVIITTRNSEVASSMDPLLTYQLNGLSDEDCWSIIKEKAFPNGHVQSGHETIGIEIAKRCQGLPLAANIVGGVLSGKSDEEWILFNENWLSDDKKVESISTLLKWSFDCLPLPSLKMCFAYCSIFPKGCKIARHELIELWMAEEFLQADRENDMESLGDMFSNVLIHNSLLLVAERDDYGNVLSFVMHDLMHDLASALRMKILGSSGKTSRYLFHGKDCSSAIQDGTEKSLRTLIFQGEILDTMFSSYTSLHALSLDCDWVKELPSSIIKLIHLRNLNVSRTGIECLPPWISKLHYLQTINASTESLRKLPSTLKYLTSLRHLYLCPDVKLPAEIGKLINLQGLKFRVGEHKGYKIEELGRMNNLKQLSICNLENVWSKEEALKALISKKRNLTELSFEWDADRKGEANNDEAVLDGLEPHSGLKMLKIAGFKGRAFPSWVNKMVVGDKSLIGLVEITLSGCQGCEEIPELGQLPNLKTLSLMRLTKVASIKPSFYGSSVRGDSFPALETLLLTGMAELRVIEYFGHKLRVFPRLVSFKLYWCHKLECLPSWLFLQARGLKELDIRNCSKLSELLDDPHTLDSLESMTIKGCQNLKSIVNPTKGGMLPSLCSLEIRDCQNLAEMVEPQAQFLKKVSMVELKSLRNLPKFLDSLEHSPSLAQLTIVGVPKFISNTKSWPFQKLRKLEIDIHMELSSETSTDAMKKTVDVMLHNCCSSLGELKLTGLEIWDVVPESIKRLTALYSLELENFGVHELPKWFKNLSYLKRLCLSNFPKLTHLPMMKKYFTKLQEFHICNCQKINMEYEGLKISHGCVIYVNRDSL